MGKETFFKYIDAFGFGHKTNIELPGEAVGQLPNYDNVGDIELATVSFGRGISVTPIQLITAVSAVANNGIMLKPNFIDKIIDQKGNIKILNQSTEIRRVVSKTTSQKTLELLENVVSQGTGVNAYIEGYRVGGKTGTAEHYRGDLYDSSFIGVFPVNDPKFVILVVLYGIDGQVYYASQTAAPVFKNIATDLIRYYKMPAQPNKMEVNELELVKLDDYSSLGLYDVKKTLKNLDLEYKIVGEGEKIIEQSPQPGAEVFKNSTVFLFTEINQTINSSYKIMLPDFREMEKEEAVDLAEKMGIKISFQGNKSKIISQTIEPGIRIDRDQLVILK